MNKIKVNYVSKKSASFPSGQFFLGLNMLSTSVQTSL